MHYAAIYAAFVYVYAIFTRLCAVFLFVSLIRLFCKLKENTTFMVDFITYTFKVSSFL